MTKWIKKWDKCSNDTGTTENFDVKSMKIEMKNALKYRSENPKKIDEFEDIYMRPQPSNIIEGLENQENSPDTTVPPPDNTNINPEQASTPPAPPQPKQKLVATKTPIKSRSF